MHILMLSLTVAFVVFTLLLVVVGPFAKTPLAHHMNDDERRHRPLLS